MNYDMDMCDARIGGGELCPLAPRLLPLPEWAGSVWRSSWMVVQDCAIQGGEMRVSNQNK